MSTATPHHHWVWHISVHVVNQVKRKNVNVTIMWCALCAVQCCVLTLFMTNQLNHQKRKCYTLSNDYYVQHSVVYFKGFIMHMAFHTKNIGILLDSLWLTLNPLVYLYTFLCHVHVYLKYFRPIMLSYRTEIFSTSRVLFRLNVERNMCSDY